MSAKVEERSISTALGSIPPVHNQRSFSGTVTIAGTGLGDITINNIAVALYEQHTLLDSFARIFDQMYVHRCRCYGTSGGYLSIAPYSHRFNYISGSTNNTGALWDAYQRSDSSETGFRKGSLCQKYEFGINGSTRPELKWDWPKDELLNNPFILGNNKAESDEGTGQTFSNNCKMLTIQSTNASGDALYIVQFDVTVRSSNFIPIQTALGGAAFGEKNVVVDNYLPSTDPEKRKEEGEKAHELANKKRKIENVKALTMPTLDSH